MDDFLKAPEVGDKRSYIVHSEHWGTPSSRVTEVLVFCDSVPGFGKVRVWRRIQSVPIIPKKGYSC